MAHPFKTGKSKSGQFGSRFVAVVISGDENGDVHLNAYQISNIGMGMIRDEVVDASTDGHLMRVRASTPQQYVPDVFYRFKNEYKVEVQEKADPTFPIDYLLVSLSEGFPQVPNSTFQTATFPIENRQGFDAVATSDSVLRYLTQSKQLFKDIYNFHFLSFLACNSFIAKEELPQLISLCKSSSGHDSEENVEKVKSMGFWKTLEAISSSSSSGTSGSSAAISSTSTATWTCPHCTFINQSSVEDCEMCGLPK
jgi:nuclear protein localization protein 4 homolog